MLAPNNRRQLVKLISEHTGKTYSEIIQNPENVDLKAILTTAWSGCPTDIDDLQKYRIWADLQLNVDVDLY